MDMDDASTYELATELIQRHKLTNGFDFLSNKMLADLSLIIDSELSIRMNVKKGAL